jgi:hypothetical protein
MNSEQPQNEPLQLATLHRSRNKTFRLTGYLSYAGILVAGFGIFTWLEGFFYLESWLKTVLVGGLLTLLVLLIFRFLRQPMMGERDFVKRLSEELESDDLIRYYDLHQQPDEGFVAAARRQLHQKLTGLNIDAALQSSRLLQRSASRLRLSASLAFTGAAILASALFLQPGAFQRLLQVQTTFYPPNPFVFSITPGDLTLEMGSAFDTRIQFRGAQPRKLWLEIRQQETRNWRRMPLQRDSDSSFAANGLLFNAFFQYRFRMDDYASGVYDVNVEMLPRWENLIVTIKPPAYTGERAQQFVYPVTQFEALPGSLIQLRGKANKPLASAQLEAFHHAPTAQAFATDSLVFTFNLERSDTLLFRLTDTLGLENKNLFQLSFTEIADLPPNIAILQPEAELQLNAPDSVYIRYISQDDYGVRSVRFFYELTKTIISKKTSSSKVLPHPAGLKLIDGKYGLDLRSLGMEAMDELTYWLEATDNDAVSGFKTAVTPKQRIRIAGLADVLMQMEEMESGIENNLGRADEEFQSLEKEFESLKDGLKRQDRQGWDQQQAVQRMEEQLKQIQEKVENARDEFDKLKEELNQNSMLSEETRRQYDELQQLLKEIDDPNILKLLEEMEKSLQNIDQNQLRKALEEFKFSEERYRERLQRTMELFKSLQTMAELDKLDKRLEELEKREQALQEPDVDQERFEKTQESVKRDLEDFQKQAKKLQEKAPEKKREAVEKLQQDLEKDARDTQRQLDEQIKQNKSGGKRPDTKPVQQRMHQMRSKIAEARQGMSQKSVNVNIAALKSSLVDLIFLSDVEEQVIDLVSSLDSRSEGFTRQARRQSSLIGQFTRVADTLASVAREIPQFPNRILDKKAEVTRRLDVSLRHLAERDKNNASSEIRFAMGGINELASLIADLISQIEDQQQSGEGGEGGMSSEQLLEQMKQMSGQQQKLNQQIQDLINDVQGNRLNQSQMDRLEQLSKQQNEIRKKLREMQQNGGLKPGDKLLSELERLAQQMEDSINELRGGNTDRTMILRQQNILSRMLEVEKALDQREEDDKRKGQRPKDLPPAVRPTMTMEELKKMIRERLQNPNATKLTPEFEELVRLYFEMIES